MEEPDTADPLKDDCLNASSGGHQLDLAQTVPFHNGSLWAAPEPSPGMDGDSASNQFVGAADLRLGSGMRVSVNGDERFPLASVCKLPIAMHIYASVDEAKLRLGGNRRRP